MLTPAPSPILNTELLTGHFRRQAVARSWREHGTSDWLLILNLDGAGRFGHADGSETISGPGDAILISPGTRHDYGPTRERGLWEILWAHFYPRRHWGDLVKWPEEAPGVMKIHLGDSSVLERVTARFEDAHRLANESLPRRDWFAMNALEEVLLWCLISAPQSESPIDQRLARMRDFLRANLSKKLALEDLSEVSSLSKSRVTQIFRRHLGMTPIQYLEELRMARAKELLTRTSLSVTEIAAAAGFEDPFYFANRFKRHSGLSPSEFRRSSRLV